MGSYSYLTIAGYPTFAHKNDYFNEVVNLLFQPKDYINEERKYSELNKLIWADTSLHKKGKYIFKGFKQSVGVCKKRLEIFGANINTVKKEWPIARKIASNNLYYNAEYSFAIDKVSFRTYYNELKEILTNSIINYEQERDTIKNSLITDGLKISGQSTANALYAMLSAVDNDEIVEYDFTEIIDSGWVKKDAPNKINHEKIIILTEGKTDAEFLGKSLKILHPELYPYYHFMDFGGFKTEGGASALVKTVKAFAAANVKHPIIAIFDNDTAGISEMQKIPIDLPINIKVIKLPDIKLARKFPTIGPAGKRLMNINRLACGIEMYLGSEVLLINGIYSMIRWNDFNKSLMQYHGSLENKEEVQQIFRKKFAQGDRWEMPEMEMVWNQIFNVFYSKRNNK